MAQGEQRLLSYFNIDRDIPLQRAWKTVKFGGRLDNVTVMETSSFGDAQRRARMCYKRGITGRVYETNFGIAMI